MIFKIGRKKIGKGQPSYIVAELSGNHNGDFRRIKKMIKEAHSAGADAVKLQTYKPDTITLNSNKPDFQITKNTPWKKSKNLWRLYSEAFTPWDWHKDIFLYARKIGIQIFSSPFDETAVDLLEDLNCPAYKVASAEINHVPLLKKIARTKKPVILSNGLASLNDIQNAISILKSNGTKDIAVLQCVSSYPAKIEEQNLSTIVDINEKFKMVSGLSDHTIGLTAACTAVAIGGSIIEKHFTLNDEVETVDSFFSLKKNSFKLMVDEIRKIELAIGKVDYEISKSSKKNVNSKRSIYISNDALKGDIVSINNIKVVRPSFGLSPKYFESVIGKKFQTNVKKGTRLTLSMVEGKIKKPNDNI